MFRRKNSLIGLDLGSSAIKAVEVMPAGDSFKIVSFGHQAVAPAANEQEEASNLRDALPHHLPVL
jgi:Tfp pilus assembly PilM family ATPase